MTDNLQEHINSLERSSAYQVERLIKQTSQEITEEVSFEGRNGAKLGPFVRKRIDRESDLGRAYEVLYGAQQANQRFLYLPRIRECYRTEDELVVVMDWVAGETLAETLQHEQPSLEFAAPLFVKLCEAVIELHTSFDPPIIHRDITPGNVVLSGGTPTLIDLGIARRYNEDAASDTHQLGTFGFAAPEQFGFGQSDQRTDVYGLGMMLYYCCTGSTPDAQARSRGFRSQNVPEEVRLVIEKATALSSADRYDSVKDLRQAFVNALQAYRMRLDDDAVDLSPKLTASIVSTSQSFNPSNSRDLTPTPPPPNPTSRFGAGAAASDSFSSGTSSRTSGGSSKGMPHESHSSPDSAEGHFARSGKTSPCSPFPFVPALVWDIVLGLAWLVCVIAMVFFGVYEDPMSGMRTPALEKPLMTGFIVVFLTLAPTLLLSSRPLQEMNPKWCLGWKGRLAIIGCEFCLLVLLLVLLSIFPE